MGGIEYSSRKAAPKRIFLGSERLEVIDEQNWVYVPMGVCRLIFLYFQ